MLVLSRRENEVVIVQDLDLETAQALLRLVLDTPRDEMGPVEHDIEQFLAKLRNRPETKVGIVDIRGEKVRIGFEGPESVKFWRQEVWDQMDRQERRLA